MDRTAFYAALRSCAAGVVEAIIQTSWAIKAMGPMPEDVMADALWVAHVNVGTKPDKTPATKE